MKRSLADFLLEIGKLDKAITIYEQTYPICPSYISLFRYWAIALYETGNLKDAVKNIFPFSDHTVINRIQMYQEHEHPHIQLHCELTYNSKSLLGKNIMKKIYNSRILVLNNIENINNPLSSMSSTAFLGHHIIQSPSVDFSKFEMPTFPAAKEEMQFIIDADRLG